MTPSKNAHRIDPKHAHGEQVAPEIEAQLVQLTIEPKFNRVTQQFEISAGQQQQIQHAVSCDSIKLDTVLVCPECECVPTFRQGCGSCGCGVVNREPLIHHFACAHVGAAEDFRVNGDLVCPKCLMNGLVAGTDFEQVESRNTCAECNAVAATTQTIGHCVSCDSRFPITAAKEKTLTGYRIAIHEQHIPQAAQEKSPSRQIVHSNVPPAKMKRSISRQPGNRLRRRRRGVK